MRSFNTNTHGSSWSEMEKQQVWSKAYAVQEYNPEFVRVDRTGRLIERKEFGNTNSQYGWEIDHIYPASRGGTDSLQNLQPLQWAVNRRKSDSLNFAY